MKAAEVDDLIRQEVETTKQALIDADLSATIGVTRGWLAEYQAAVIPK